MSKKIDLICIIDKSGSMFPLIADTVGGYNQFLESQKELEGETMVTTVLFNHEHYTLYDHVPIEKARLNQDLYKTSGSTAMLDAVGMTLNQTYQRIISSPEYERPSQVIVVIITDGLENASHKYDYPGIRRLISRMKEEQRWNFVFLGANIDVESERRKMGLAQEEAKVFHSTSEGMQDMYCNLNMKISELRIKGKDEDDKTVPF
jgi:Mg-chelatase subunit ChlD